MKSTVLALGAVGLLLCSVPGALAAECETVGAYAYCEGDSDFGGGNGEDAPHMVVNVPVTSGDFVVYSRGGFGAAGLTAIGGSSLGADIVLPDGGQFDTVTISAIGRDGVARGGNGGPVDLTMQDGASAENVFVQSVSGGGIYQVDGDGGDGGSIEATLSGTVTNEASFSTSGGTGARNGVSGDAGDVYIVVSTTGDVATLIIDAIGGARDAGVPGTGPIGKAGKVDVEVAGKLRDATITSSGLTDSAVNVVLQDGSVVSGEIQVLGNNNATLTFDMKMTNRREYRAAMNVLLDPTKPAGGTIIVNEQSYSWSGFDQLVNLLEYVGTTQPKGEVQIIVWPRTDKAAAPAFSCDNVAVHPAAQADGSIALYAKVAGRKGKSLIGLISGGRFAGAGVGWSAAPDGNRWAVVDPAGGVVAYCS